LIEIEGCIASGCQRSGLESDEAPASTCLAPDRDDPVIEPPVDAFDPDTREVFRAGQLRPVSPKAFALLDLMIECRPKAVSKGEIHSRLWPDTHVLEANLPNLVTEVRAAVADIAQRPRFIRTVHAFGYAFCGEATEIGGAASLAVPEQPFVYSLIWAGGRVMLGEGEHLLGRHPRSVVPLDAETVSRRHARLRIAEGKAIIEDLRSRNGTFVRGERLVSPAVLVDGEEFRLGSAPLTFRSARTPDFPDTRDG
jgi:DNA-binding winged helix-turn-helix (wHTH) protein